MRSELGYYQCYGTIRVGVKRGGDRFSYQESVGCSTVVAAAAAAVRLRSEKVTIRITIQRCYVTIGVR